MGALTRRVLPRDEYHRLAGTVLASAAPQFDGGAYVVVVEDEGEIVACGAVFQAWHLDGAWVTPERRGRASVGRALLAGLREVVTASGARELLTMTCDRDTSHLHTAFGPSLPLDGQHFAIAVER